MPGVDKEGLEAVWSEDHYGRRIASVQCSASLQDLHQMRTGIRKLTVSKHFPPMRAMMIAISLLPFIACTNTRQPGSVDVALQKLKAKDYAGCIVEIDQVLAAGRASAVAHVARAYCRSAIGDVDGAIADYTSAIALSPNNPASFNNRGAERMRKRDIDAGLSDFARAVQIRPRYAEAVRNLGTAQRLKGNPAEALVEYSRAIELEPSNAQGYFDRGVTRIETGDEAGGLEDLNSAIERNPKSAAIYAARADVYRQQNDDNAAVADLNKAIELDPQNAGLFYRRGCLYYDRHAGKEALADFAKAIQIDPKNEDYARVRTALVYLRLNERDQVKASLRQLSVNSDRVQDEWPARIAAFLNGDVNRDAFLAWAASSPSLIKERECQAYFYAGTLRLINHDARSAGSDFEHAVGTTQKALLEYSRAQAELHPLEGRR